MEKLNMKKFPLRLLGAILAALLVLAVFPISALAGDGIELVLDVDKETAIEGNEVTVTVKIGGSNSGIASMCFDLEYNADVFTLKENSAVILGDFASEAGWLDLMEERQGVDNITAVNPQDEKVTFNWIYNGALNGQTNYEGTNTDFAELVFTVKEGVTENKKVDFVLKPSEENIFSIAEKMPPVPVSGYTSEKTIVKSVTVKKSYTVTYDANEGTGAPEDQKKVDGVALTLSETVPTRDGYKFLGWATTSEGTAAYQPGGTYKENAALELFAVWKKRANNIVFSVSEVTEARGGKAKLAVSVTGTPEATNIVLPISFGTLNFDSVTGEGWEYSDKKLVWNGTAKDFADGELVKFDLKIPPETAIGDVEVTLGNPTVKDGGYTYPANTITANNGKVTVVDYILGDVNGDGIVDLADCMILKRHVAKWNAYKVLECEMAADVNDDGNIDLADCMILKRHVAKWNAYKTLPYKG